MGNRGFAILTTTGGEYHYNLMETPNGFVFVKYKGDRVYKEIQLSKSTRNWMQAEIKAKKVFRNEVIEAQRNGTFIDSYSSIWHEPDVKYVGKDWAIKK